MMTAGCAPAGRMRRCEERVSALEAKGSQDTEILARKDVEIGGMRRLIRQQEAMIKAKNKRIEEMKRKLEGFGVF